VNVRFELYGVPRLRAGRDRVAVSGATVGAALAELELACPGLAGTVLRDGRLLRHYRLSLNGQDFVSDPDRVLAEGDTLILLSAEAGG
jgi:sulfur-carrier protein